MTRDKPQHVHPGPASVNPVVINDSYRSAPESGKEPMYLISESEWGEAVRLPESAFNGMSFDDVQFRAERIRKISEIIRARGPVAQQAPEQCDIGYVLSFLEQDIESKDIPVKSFPCGDHTGNCRWVRLEDVVEIFVSFIPQHDAALIAQEREKWERERDAEIPKKYAEMFSCDACGDIRICGKKNCFHYTKIRNKDLATMLSNTAAQARGDVLDELKQIVQKKYDSAYKNTCRYDRETLGDQADEVNNKFYFNTYCGYATAFGTVLNDIESLRSKETASCSRT